MRINVALYRMLAFLSLFCVLAIASQVSTAAAATISASACTSSAVQTAVNSAAVGDTVRVPAGNCAWSGPVSWTNKNVQVIGAGKDVTNISCDFCFNVVSTASTSIYSRWRVSGMTLKAAAPSGTTFQIWDNVGSAHTGWRIDHVKFSKPGAGSGYGVFVGGPTYGLIDNNDFNWGNGLAIIVSTQMATEYPSGITNLQGGYTMSLPPDFGTANALYVEDNTFTSTASGGCAAYDTSSGGGRVVFRYNVLTGCMFYVHWTRSAEVGGILSEIYNNKFIGNSAYNAYPIRLESGTGVIFNNAVQMANNYAVFDERRGVSSGFGESSAPLGSCDGGKAWDGNAGDASAPGWPCLGQIGRAPGKTLAQIKAGDKQASAPIYLWNNGPQEGCRTGGSCTNSFRVDDNPPYVKATPHPNGQVDYVLNGTATKPGYSPYTYPHPLQTSRIIPPPDEPTVPVITSGLTATGTVGVLFRYTITAANSPTRFVAVGLPAGISLNTQTGLISGIPVSIGAYSVTIRAINAAGHDTAKLSLTINRAPLPSSALVGSDAVLGGVDSNSSGMAEAFQAVAQSSGTMKSLSIYLDATSTTTRLVAGIYSNGGGRPGALIAQGAITSPRAGAWNNVVVPAADIVAGRVYWIAILGTNQGVIRFRDTVGSCRAETSAQSSLNNLPSTWTSGQQYTTCPVSGYGRT